MQGRRIGLVESSQAMMMYRVNVGFGLLRSEISQGRTIGGYIQGGHPPLS